MKWSEDGFPHKGWNCVEMFDVLDGNDDMPLSERGEFYETCEVCGQEKIRYIHIMENVEYDGQIRVGCSCASSLEENYKNSENREKDFINKMKRKKTFLKTEWWINSKGNRVAKYKGINITIVPDRFAENKYLLCLLNRRYYLKEENNELALKKAKSLSFEIIDSYLRK